MPDGYNLQQLRKKEHFAFHCTRCGDCCRNVKESVMLESQDAYKLAKYLKQNDNSIERVEDMLLKFADVIPLTDNGFPIYVLKTLGEDNTCIFLKENGCSVYSARPRACRLYPITAAPRDDERDFDYLLCKEKPHHFNGGSVSVKDWIRKNFKRDEREYICTEYDTATTLGKLMERINEETLARAIVAMLSFRFYEFDLNESFMPQYLKNMKKLEIILKVLVNEQEKIK